MSVEVNSSPINTTPFKKKSKPDPVEFMPNIWMQSYIKLREFLYFLSGFGSYLVLALNVLLLYVKFKQKNAVVMVFIQDNTMIYIEYALIGISIANCIQFFMFSTKQIVLFNHVIVY